MYLCGDNGAACRSLIRILTYLAKPETKEIFRAL
jgi:ABC-type transport system involved in cytochrome c biogenesis ATPase subunit